MPGCEPRVLPCHLPLCLCCLVVGHNLDDRPMPARAVGAINCCSNRGGVHVLYLAEILKKKQQQQQGRQGERYRHMQVGMQHMSRREA